MTRFRLPLIALVALLSAGCAARHAKPSAGEAPAPHKVLLVALDPVGHPSVSWPVGGGVGLSLGMILGSGGGGLSTGVGVNSGGERRSEEERIERKVRFDVGDWDYEAALQRVAFSTATTHPGWILMDGGALPDDLRADIASSYFKHKGQTPAVVTYAQKNGIDRLLIVEAAFYGIHRKAGYLVQLNGALLEPSAKRRVLAKASARSPARDPSADQMVYNEQGENDREALRAGILDETETAAHRLLATLGD